ncbi:MAG: PAS domain-containing protein [Anaerolineaceae bacterium]|nr:PAS domain-containing protein [Anaerolineaceae bacterium]
MHLRYQRDQIDTIQSRVEDLFQQYAEQLSTTEFREAILDEFSRCISGQMQVEAERQQLKEEYDQHREVLNAIFEADPSGLAVVAGAELRFVYANPAYRFIIPETGIDPIGQPYSQIWGCEEDGCYAEQIERVVATGKPYQQTGYERRFPDGAARIFSLQARRIDWGGQPAALIILWDITETTQAEQSTLASERRVSTILASITDCCYFLDREWRFTRINDPALVIFHKTMAEMLGKRFWDVFPEARGTVIEEKYSLAMREQVPVHYQTLSPISGLWVEVQAYPSTEGMFVIFRDITRIIEKEKELQQLNRTLRALNSSSQAMIRAVDETSYLAEACQIITRDCGHALVWIGYAGEDAAKTVRPVAFGGFEAGYLDTLNVTWADEERGRGPTGTAIRTGKASLCRNMLTDPMFKPWREEALKRGYASSISLPLTTNGKVIGAITIYSSEPDPFSEAEIKLLGELADNLAYGIQTLRLRAVQAQMEETMRQSLEREKKLIESEASFHESQARMEVQRRLLDQREQERLQIARDLHDGPVQELAGVNFALQNLLMEDCEAEVAAQLQEIRMAVVAQIGELRTYASVLRPPALSAFGLGKAIRSHLDTFHGRHPEMHTHFEESQVGELLSEEMRLAFYRIYQEAMANVAKHSQATDIHIRLEKSPTQVTLVIEDDGVGFTIPRDWVELARGGHLGLVGLRERAEAIGGRVEIATTPRHGTRVTVVVPLDNQG